MCVICASAAGKRQPTETEIRTMFERNPDGAGYMVARAGKVLISKGYMDVESFLHAIRYEHFTDADPVVYHFRISTQAGVNPEMTHPFPLSSRLKDMTEQELTCKVGIAHNGIIRMTSDHTDTKYSDTARFITRYLVKIIRNSRDLHSQANMEILSELTNSRLAIMDGSGYIAYAGHWIDFDGLRFSNSSFMPQTYSKNYIYGCNFRAATKKTKSFQGFDDMENY